MILIPSPGKIVAIPPYLIYLLFLMLGHYFAAHGVTIATRDDPAPSPLYLPGGVVRLLIIVSLVACIGWKLYSNETVLREQFEASLEALKEQPFLPLVILAGFFLGVVVRAILGSSNRSIAVQSFEAWISLIALIAIVVASMIHLVIDPSLKMEDKLFLPTWEGFVGGVVAFYFGERS
jgi:hypothetical protein